MTLYKKSINIFLKIIKTIAEIFIPYILFILIQDVNDDANEHFFDDANGFLTLFYTILVLEWIRRYRLKENRPHYEQYFYFSSLFIIFFLVLFFLK